MSGSSCQRTGGEELDVVAEDKVGEIFVLGHGGGGDNGTPVT